MPIRLRRNARSKRFVLRGSGGVIQLTIPTWGRQREAEAWVREQTAFIEKELASEGDAVPFVMGTRLPVLGREMEIVPGLKTTGEFGDDSLAIAPTPSAKLASRVETALRDLVLREARRDLEKFWSLLDVPFAPVSVRSYTRRWGACGPSGETLINWRLVFAPREVLRSVCAHEAAHRIEMNHSWAFYAVLDKLLPERAAAEAWLRQHGARLGAYGRTPA